MPLEAPNNSPHSQSWFITSRLGDYEGEVRVNLLRVMTICTFYTVHLINMRWFMPDAPSVTAFHRQVSLAATFGLMIGVVAAITLSRHYFPAFLKYVLTLGDLLLVSMVASIPDGNTSGLTNGPNSPVVLAYFIVIAFTSLRLSLGLVWFATVGSMLCYVTLPLNAAIYTSATTHITPIRLMCTLVCLGGVGVVIGQGVRRTRALAEDFLHRTNRRQDSSSQNRAEAQA